MESDRGRVRMIERGRKSKRERGGWEIYVDRERGGEMARETERVTGRKRETEREREREEKRWTEI